MKYVLSSDNYGVGNCHWDGYYIGKTYIYQGEPYAICDKDLQNAKIYSSYNRAKSACEKLNGRICNYEFKVKEIEE